MKPDVSQYNRIMKPCFKNQKKGIKIPQNVSKLTESSQMSIRDEKGLNLEFSELNNHLWRSPLYT